MHEQVEDTEYQKPLEKQFLRTRGLIDVCACGRGRIRNLKSPWTHEGRQCSAAALLHHGSLTRRSGTLWPTPPTKPSSQVHTASSWFSHGETYHNLRGHFITSEKDLRKQSQHPKIQLLLNTQFLPCLYCL